jgi:hypothetical protein
MLWFILWRRQNRMRRDLDRLLPAPEPKAPMSVGESFARVLVVAIVGVVLLIALKGGA